MRMQRKRKESHVYFSNQTQQNYVNAV